MHGGILNELTPSEEGLEVMEIDVSGSKEEIGRLNDKRPKAETINKHKRKNDKVKDAVSLLAGLLLEEQDEDDVEDCDAEDMVEGDSDCQSKYRGPLLEQEYSSMTNRHSKAGGV